MAGTDRIRRQQILREAEGYLDLINLFGDEMTLPPAIRKCLAQHSLDALDRLAESFAAGPQAQFLRGQALRAAERYHEAIEPLKQAAEAEPTDLEIWLALGWCYKRISRIDLAIEALDQALAVDSQQAIIPYNLACYWSLAGNAQLALQYLAQALSLDPQYRQLAEKESDFDPIRSDPGFQSLTSIIV
ncbi:MAG TPA: tetratricopeptide repeat protein [Pirellulales bacterium]